jgi:4-hydroxy-4-methyl-2-oxoglutarate aldolase
MSSDQQEVTVLELQARWDRIRIANVYDALDRMGHPNQCMDLRIRPLFPSQHLAGKAVTVRGGRDPLTRQEFIAAGRSFSTPAALKPFLFPGSVVVVDCGGEPVGGKFGEMTSWSLKQGGAKGIVLDSYIRDRPGLEIIPDYTVCAVGTSPVETLGRWRPHEFNVPIAMPGTLTSQIRVNPGDWIVGGPDGVMVVPLELSLEALAIAERLEAEEQGMREDLAAGMSFEDAFKKWGRA